MTGSLPPGAAAAFLLAGMAACGEGAPPEAAQGAELAEWTLGPEPLIEIGVREGGQGGQEYELHRVRDAALLPDGRLAVLNAGTGELRLYDSTGAHTGSVGGEGDGPAEFRFPTRLRISGDTLLVVDDAVRGVTAVSVEGEVLDRRPLPGFGERPFPAETWITGRSWVEGAPPGPARRAAARILSSLPASDTTRPFRFVLLAEDGGAWMTDRPPPWPDGAFWTVLDSGGGELAVLRTPPDFLPTRISSERVVGIAYDGLDGQRVEVRAVRSSGAGDGPGVDAAPSEQADVRVPEHEPAGGEVGVAGTQARGVVRMLTGVQEQFFASRVAEGEPARYARSLDELFDASPPELPPGLRAEVITASGEGWLGLAEAPGRGVRCVVNMGAPYVAGVPLGRARCWREAGDDR